MTPHTNDKCGKNACLSSAITEIDSEIHFKSARLRQLKAQTRTSIGPLADKGPLSVNPKLWPVPAPSHLVVQGVYKRLRAYRQRMAVFRDAYLSKMNDFKQKEKAKQKELQISLSIQDHLLREHREIILVGDIHGISVTSASRNSIERQLRMLRRGGTVQVPANNVIRVVQRLGKRGTAKKLVHCHADVSEYVPTQYGTRLDGMCRRVEDPMKEHYDVRVINPWTMRERSLFLKLFIWIGKDFGKIAQYFTFKSTQDVVRFYYEHKLTFRLNEMRKRHLEGNLMADEDISRLSRTGTMAANMTWNFVREKRVDGEQLDAGDYKMQDSEALVREEKDHRKCEATLEEDFRKVNDRPNAVGNEVEENLILLTDTFEDHNFTPCTDPNVLIESGSPCSIMRQACSRSICETVKIQ